MSDDYLEPGSGKFSDSENPPPGIDPEDAQYYSLSREIWTIRIERDEQDEEVQQDDFARQFATQFHAHFGDLAEEERPQHKIFFWPRSRDKPDILVARILVRGISDANRAATEAFFAQQQGERQTAEKEYDSLCRSLQPGNWGGGGPGGSPIPVLSLISDKGLNSGQSTLYDFVLPTKQPDGNPDAVLSTIQKNYGGQDVQVVILDTAPHPQIWENAKNKHPNHPIIKSLANQIDIRAEKGSKWPVLTTNDEKEISDTLAKNNVASYPMVDHGLFVAGIIHSIAPKASITLYRVLDDNGVGWRSLVDFCLWRVAREYTDEDNPLIFNCSLNMILANDEMEENRKTLGEMEANWASIRNDAIIVGAAGNEGLYRTRLDGSKPPYPRYPAGFTKTLGVSALNQAGERASYANWAEDYDIDDLISQTYKAGWYSKEEGKSHDQRIGIATMGGDIMSLGHLRVTNPFDSILGAYITYNGFPGLAYSVINQHNGWARWSGTSFANAIVSGVLALIASYRRANSLSNDQKFLVEDLLKYCEGRLNQDGNDYEYILKVSQGT